MENFRQRNPNLEVIGAYYHDDEIRDDGKGGKIQGAPHLHVDYIPVSRNRWQNFIDKQNKQEGLIDKLTGKKIEKKTRVNGLDVENSLTEALEAQGYISKELDVSVIERSSEFIFPGNTTRILRDKLNMQKNSLNVKKMCLTWKRSKKPWKQRKKIF